MPAIHTNRGERPRHWRGGYRVTERLRQTPRSQLIPLGVAAAAILFALLYVIVIANPSTGVARQLADDELRIGVRQPRRVRLHAARRAHVRRAAVHRRERLLAHLRAHAGGQHGPRLLLPPRRLHRLRDPAVDDRSGLLRPAERREHLGMGAAAARGDGRDRALRPGDAAAPAPLEPGPGSPAGAHHDRRLADRRRPGDRPLPAPRPRRHEGLRRERRRHRLARDGRTGSSTSTSGASSTRSRGS